MRSLFLVSVLLLGISIGVTTSVGNSARGEALERKAWPSVPPQFLKSTVRIRMDGRVIGSGVAVRPTLILTARHVAFANKDEENDSLWGKRKYSGPGNFEVEVFTVGHKGVIWSAAKLVASLSQYDVAFMSIENPVLGVADTAGPVTTEIGDAVLMIGASAGTHPKATLGYLSSKESEGYAAGCWEISNAGYFGNSGGPVFDMNTGRLIGICVMGIGNGFGTFAPNCIFMEPWHRIEKVLAKVK